MSFVGRSNIQCPYLGGSTIGGSTVYTWQIYICYISSIQLKIVTDREKSLQDAKEALELLLVQLVCTVS